MSRVFNKGRDANSDVQVCSIFYEIIITVFQSTQRAIENRSTCHAWHACRRLPTPALGYIYVRTCRVRNGYRTVHADVSCMYFLIAAFLLQRDGLAPGKCAQRDPFSNRR